MRLTETAVRSAPAVLGYGTSLAVILAAFNYTGGRLVGAELDPEVDEVARKEYLRKNRRRSIEETINELGEGRGTYWRACSTVMAALRGVYSRLTNHRCTWSRLCRAKSSTPEGGIRHRCRALTYCSWPSTIEARTLRLVGDYDESVYILTNADSHLCIFCLKASFYTARRSSQRETEGKTRTCSVSTVLSFPVGAKGALFTVTSHSHSAWRNCH